MPYVLEINDLAELAAYRSDWCRLHQETQRASFFLTQDWLEAYWTHFGHGQRLRVLLVCEGRGSGRTTLGILPLCVREEHYKLGPLRVLTYPLHDWHSYYGPLGPERRKTLEAGLKHIRRTSRDWDLVDLRWTDEELDRGQTREAMAAQRLVPLRQPWQRSGMISLAGDWEQWWQARSGKWRHNLQRHQRRLGERGHLEHIRYRPAGSEFGEAEPRWDLYHECEAVAARSWQGSSESGTTLTHATVQPFFRDCHERATRLGMVDLNLLRIDGRPAAFVYNYACRGHLQGVRVGFDESVSRQGAGGALYVVVIEDSFRRGDVRFDLGPGSLEAKRHLITHAEICYRYTYFSPRSWRAQFLKAKHLAKRWWERELPPGGSLPGKAESEQTRR